MASLNAQVPDAVLGPLFSVRHNGFLSPNCPQTCLFQIRAVTVSNLPCVTVILVLGPLFTPYNFYLLRNCPSQSTYHAVSGPFQGLRREQGAEARAISHTRRALALCWDRRRPRGGGRAVGGRAPCGRLSHRVPSPEPHGHCGD